MTGERQQALDDSVRLAMSGDDDARVELVRQWYGRIYALCQAHLRSRVDAEDAVQETFMRGLSRLHELHTPAAVGGWLRGIAHHVCVDLIRRNRVREGSPRDVADAATADGDHAAAANEERDRLIGLVHDLPEALRETILLHYYEDMTYDQMAAWLGVARSTVNDRLSRARSLLKHQLLSQRCPDEM